MSIITPSDREFAECALKKIFIGSSLDGIKFGVGPRSTFIYFIHYSDREPDKLWINIEVNKFTVLNNKSKSGLLVSENIKELCEEEAINTILEIRREKIVDMSLGENSPSLMISFNSGKCLYINGYDENLECWQAGDGEGFTGDDWLIVAVPGNEIAAWTPDDFELN